MFNQYLRLPREIVTQQPFRHERFKIFKIKTKTMCRQHKHTSHYIHVSNVHCGSVIAPEVCGPPHYCVPLVCVFNIKARGRRAVWRLDQPKTKAVTLGGGKKEKKKERIDLSGAGLCTSLFFGFFPLRRPCPCSNRWWQPILLLSVFHRDQVSDSV